jgi:hypothetical protein
MSQMQPPETALAPRLDKLAGLMRERLQLGGSDLRRTLKKARGRMPRRFRREIDHMLQALDLVAHPKLARQVDMARIGRAADEMTEFLKTIDVQRLRELRMFDIATTLALNLVLLAALVAGFAWWQGLF